MYYLFFCKLRNLKIATLLILSILAISTFASVALADLNLRSTVENVTSSEHIETDTDASLRFSIECVFQGSNQDERCHIEGMSVGCAGVGSCHLNVNFSTAELPRSISLASTCGNLEKVQLDPSTLRMSPVVFDCSAKEEDVHETQSNTEQRDEREEISPTIETIQDTSRTIDDRVTGEDSATHDGIDINQSPDTEIINLEVDENQLRDRESVPSRDLVENESVQDISVQDTEDRTTNFMDRDDALRERVRETTQSLQDVREEATLRESVGPGANVADREVSLETTRPERDSLSEVNRERDQERELEEQSRREISTAQDRIRSWLEEGNVSRRYIERMEQSYRAGELTAEDIVQAVSDLVEEVGDLMEVDIEDRLDRRLRADFRLNHLQSRLRTPGRVDSSELEADGIALTDPREIPDEFVDDDLVLDDIAPTVVRDNRIEELVFSGRTRPHETILLYIFSDPIIVTVQADAEGRWTYHFREELPDGEHTVYVARVDETGVMQARSRPFPFVKVAEAVEFTPQQVVANVPDSRTGFLTTEIILLVSGALVVLVVISLVLIGHRFASADAPIDRPKDDGGTV